MILEELKERLEGKVERIELEGPTIVLYTKDKEFFLTCESLIKELASKFKKRINVRVEKDLLPNEEEVKEKVRKIVPEKAEITQLVFEPESSIVYIHAKRPGVVIGKGGETIRKLRQELLWTPKIERVPSIPSKVVEGIRKLLYEERSFRKDFLQKLGQKTFQEKPEMREWIRLIALGGFREVGRSCLLLETRKSKVLIDCGVKLGSVKAYPYLNVGEFNLGELDAILLSHAHLDHCGFIPYLYEHGYEGPLYATSPTIDLFALLCFDYIEVLQSLGIQPPFTAKGIKEALRRSVALEYEEVSDITPDIRLTFFNAGHLLGSSLIHLNIGDGMHNLVYACDIHHGKSALLEPASTDIPRVDTLIIESTYGSKQDVMPSRQQAEHNLLKLIDVTLEKGGTCLIPSFGVGRAQEVMCLLEKYGIEYPIYLDGMIYDANGIHSAYPEYLSNELQRSIFADNDPFLSKRFKPIHSKEDREKSWENPCIIISTSGMLNGGPILQHLAKLALNENNCLIFVGYQCEGTLGRRIQKGWREVQLKVNGLETVQLKLRVETVEGLSGHSDRNGLLNFINRLKRPKRVIVCHGEAKKTLELARDVENIFKIEALAPANLEAVRLK